MIAAILNMRNVVETSSSSHPLRTGASLFHGQDYTVLGMVSAYCASLLAAECQCFLTPKW